MQEYHIPQAVRHAVIILFFGVFLLANLSARAETKILLLGGSQSLHSSEAAFPPDQVGAHLQAILAGDSQVSQPATVQVQNTYCAPPPNQGLSGRSLMTWYYWPDTWDTTQALLKQGWDSIVVMDDPYVASMTQEYHFEGVRAVTEVARTAGTEPMVVMLWSSGTTSLAKFAEGAYRVGDGLGLNVVPAGYAWDNLGSLKDSGTRPTARGAYVTAATIYSRLHGRSAAASTYRPAEMTEQDCVAIADIALQTVQAEQANSHYSGPYAGATRYLGINQRFVQTAVYQSSSTGALSANMSGFHGVLNGNYLQFQSPTASTIPLDIGHKVDLAITYPPYSTYLRPALWKNTVLIDYKYDVTSPKNMRYNLDTVISNHAGTMSPQDIANGAAFCPNHLVWAKLRAMYPTMPYVGADLGHYSAEFFAGISSMLYTMTTGHCAIGPEPAPGASTYNTWLARKVGYETAVQMCTFRQRVHGFEVVTTDKNSRLTAAAVEPVKVRFYYQPTSNVTVSISAEPADVVDISSTELTFTPANFSTQQTVTVTLRQNYSATTPLKLKLVTSSADEIFNGLTEQWDYLVNAGMPEGIGQNLPVPADASPVGITLMSNAADAGYGAVGAWRITNLPSNGSLTGTVPNLTYTPKYGSFDDVFIYQVYDSIGEASPATQISLVGDRSYEPGNLTWDFKPDVAGIQKGASFWDSTTRCWWDGQRNVAFRNGDNVIFGAGDYAELKSNFTVNHMQFGPSATGICQVDDKNAGLSLMNTGGITVEADAQIQTKLIVYNDQTWSVASGKNLLMTGIANFSSYNVTLAGSGTVSFVALDGADAAGTGASITINPESTLLFGAWFKPTGPVALMGSGTVVFGGGAKQNDLIYSGVSWAMSGGLIRINQSPDLANARATWWGNLTAPNNKSSLEIPQGNAINIRGLTSLSCDRLTGEGIFYYTNGGAGTFALTMGANNSSTDGGVTPGIAAFSGTFYGSATAWNLIKTGSGTQVLERAIPGTGTITVKGGVLSLDNTGNSFSGRIYCQNGILDIKSIGNVGSGSSSAGAPITAGYGTIALGSADTTGTLRFTGTNDCVTDRIMALSGTTGGGVIDNSSPTNSALVFTSNLAPDMNGLNTRTLTLAGSSTGENEFRGNIANYRWDKPTAVAKSGPGKWILSGTNAYTGATSVNQGTLVLKAARLADAADVNLTTGANLELAFSGTDTIRMLKIDGVAQPKGTWGALGSAATYKTALITGTGLLKSGSTTPFMDWAVSMNLDGTSVSSSGFNADPDKDGLPNGLEWILGKNPMLKEADSWQARCNGGIFDVSFQRNDSSESSSALAVEWSTDLVNWQSVPIGASSSAPDSNGIFVSVVENAASPDAITISLPTTLSSSAFVRLKAVAY